MVEEFGENVDKAKLAGVTLFKHKNECVCYYTVFIVVAVIALTVSIRTGVYFAYYKYMDRNRENVPIYDYVYQKKSY